ncbi:MAG: hypothetical protein ACI88A_004908 [Paraglaciecola sp.]|jgi:hypothetical protein
MSVDVLGIIYTLLWHRNDGFPGVARLSILVKGFGGT